MGCAGFSWQKLDNDADAIMRSAREFLRLTALRELAGASGMVL